MAAEFLFCTEIEGNYYISNFLIEQCNDNERYTLWKSILIWPSIVLIIILFPIILFLYMFRHRKNLLDTKFSVYFGFLSQGYSLEMFYWY